MCKRAGTHATYCQTLNKIRIASVWVKIGGMAERRETYSKVYQLRPNLQNSLESLGLVFDTFQENTINPQKHAILVPEISPLPLALAALLHWIWLQLVHTYDAVDESWVKRRGKCRPFHQLSGVLVPGNTVHYNFLYFELKLQGKVLRGPLWQLKMGIFVRVITSKVHLFSVIMTKKVSRSRLTI